MIKTFIGKNVRTLALLPVVVLLMATLLSMASAVRADNGAPSPSETQQQRKAEYEAAAAAANAALIKSPADVKLSDRATLHLPAGADWVPQAQADRYQRAMGHRHDPNLLGIVSGGSKDHGWIAIVTITSEGFVKDDEAAKLDPAEILAGLQRGQDQANEERVSRGFEPLILGDWMQPPRYDMANKWLVWALPVHMSENVDHPTINYNTRALGREGYLSLNLLTDREHFEADKIEAGRLLKSIEYTSGHRYMDFDPSTDKVAAYGLAALVGAVALKKLGLLALASALILKFAKIGIILFIGAFAGVRRFLFRGKRDSGAQQ